MERTVRLRLQITAAHDAALRETTAQFTASFHHVCAVGWQQRNGNAYTLYHLTYHDCKTANPALVSDLHIQARQKASEAVKAAVTREKHALPTRCPQSVACPPRYNVHTFRVDWTQQYKAAAKGCRVAAADPRHSSQRCHRCGFTACGNRPDQSTFWCRACGYRHNADLNAAKNLHDKHLVGWASSPASAPPSSGVSSHPLG